MKATQDTGASPALTLDSAASQLQRVLPDLRDTETAPEPKGSKQPTPRPAKDAAPKPPEEPDEAPAAEEDAPTDAEERESEDDDAPEGEESPDDTSDERDEPAEDDPATETDAAESPAAESKLALTLDGQPWEGTKAELEAEVQKRGMRQADYTRKTQELAAKRNEFAQKLAQVDAVLAELSPSEPDWVALSQSDPNGYLEQRAEWDLREKQRAAVRHEMQRVQQELHQEQMAAAQQHLAVENQKLVAAVPEWADSQTMQKELADLAKFAMEVRGFTKEELAGVTDSRLLLLLRDVQRAHKAAAERPKVVEQAKVRIDKVKAATPGPAVNPKARAMSEQTKARLRLNRTGDINDAARLIEMGLPD